MIFHKTKKLVLTSGCTLVNVSNLVVVCVVESLVMEQTDVSKMSFIAQSVDWTSIDIMQPKDAEKKSLDLQKD